MTLRLLTALALLVLPAVCAEPNPRISSIYPASGRWGAVWEGAGAEARVLGIETGPPAAGEKVEKQLVKLQVSLEASSGVPGFDPSVRLYELSGNWFDSERLNELAFNDEPLYFPGLSTDACLVHRFERGGQHCAKVQGFSGQGGPDSVYRLRIVPEITRPPSLRLDAPANWEERQFTRVLSEDRLQDLRKRGGLPLEGATVETYRAARENEPPPVMTAPRMVEGRIEQPAEAHHIRLKLRDRCGRDAVGQSALLARRFIQVGSRFVTAVGFHSNSWDTHAKNDEGHKDRLCPPLDRTLSALLDDLSDRGLLDSTVVLAMGEFGRTPFVNPDRGRDHWPTCWSLVLAGGGIKGGQVVGSSDENGANPTSRATSMGDVFATIYKAFGIDWTKEYDTPIGRPVKIANSLDDGTGAPLRELL